MLKNKIRKVKKGGIAISQIFLLIISIIAISYSIGSSVGFVGAQAGGFGTQERGSDQEDQTTDIPSNLVNIVKNAVKGEAANKILKKVSDAYNTAIADGKTQDEALKIGEDLARELTENKPGVFKSIVRFALPGTKGGFWQPASFSRTSLSSPSLK